MKVSFTNHEKYDYPIMCIESCIDGDFSLYDITKRDEWHKEAASTMINLAAAAMHLFYTKFKLDDSRCSTKMLVINGRLTVITKVPMDNSGILLDDNYMTMLKRISKVIDL